MSQQELLYAPIQVVLNVKHAWPAGARLMSGALAGA